MAKKGSPGNGKVKVAIGVAGAGVGFTIARATIRPGSAAVSKMVEIVATQTALQTAGPIVAAAILGSSTIISAVAIPLVVTWALRERKENDSQEEDEDETEA